MVGIMDSEMLGQFGGEKIGGKLENLLLTHLSGAQPYSGCPSDLQRRIGSETCIIIAYGWPYNM